MCFKPINGYTKESIKDVIRREFKGKAVDGYACRYLTADGRKCAVGLFIPDGHEAQGYQGAAEDLLARFEDLHSYMPLDGRRDKNNPYDSPLQKFQAAHDDLSSSLSVEEQRDVLLRWVEEFVADVGEAV